MTTLAEGYSLDISDDKSSWKLEALAFDVVKAPRGKEISSAVIERVRRWAKSTQHISSRNKEGIGRARLLASHASRAGASNLQLQREFSRHARKWRMDTAVLSSITQKMSHPSYLRIIALGNPVIPLILRDLKANGGHWYAALEALVGETPAISVAPGDIVGLKASWLRWGEKHGYFD